MKKVFSLLLALLICITITGCDKKEKIENPIIKYETLDAANIKAGVSLVKPAIPGVEEDYIGVIDNNTAVYRFYINGYEYVERGCRDTSIDMCGLLTENYKTLFHDRIEEKEAYGEAEGYKAYRFLLGRTQYIFLLYDPNNEIPRETFDQQYNAIRRQIIETATFEGAKYALGTYQEKELEGISATITLSDINAFNINIVKYISDDVYEEYCFDVKGSYMESNCDNITHSKVTINENGEKITEVLETGLTGLIKFDENEFTLSTKYKESTFNFIKVNE